jgi:prepilin signal peptidase PulO-like enzyme (type II secretory pathway)
MIYIFYIFVFIFGLIVGSFLNCVIFRLEKEESFVHGRSHCQNCKHHLSWLDLVPVLSYVFLMGRCRYCHAKISAQYPIIEIATGLIFVIIFNFQYPLLFANFMAMSGLNYLSLLNVFLLLAIASLAIVVFVFDLRHFLIPDNFVYLLTILAVAYQILNINIIGGGGAMELFNPIFSGLIPAGLFLSLILISRGKWMGMGDVKLALFMGVFLGSPNIFVALFFAFIIGAIIGTGAILLGKKKMKSEIPFGPFLLFGAAIALLFGNQIISWYINLII